MAVSCNVGVCYRASTVSALKVFSDKPLQQVSYFWISGNPLLAVFTSCLGVPIFQEWWFTRVRHKFATRVRHPSLSTYPSCESVPCKESTVPSPSSWANSPGGTPSNTIHHNMNLVPYRGTPGLYFPGCCTWSESLVALDFDPFACPATKAFFWVWLSSLSIYSGRPLSSLVTS